MPRISVAIHSGCTHQGIEIIKAPRWQVVTELRFPLERQALKYLRHRLLDSEPFRLLPRKAGLCDRWMPGGMSANQGQGILDG